MQVSFSLFGRGTRSSDSVHSDADDGGGKITAYQFATLLYGSVALWSLASVFAFDDDDDDGSVWDGDDESSSRGASVQIASIACILAASRAVQWDANMQDYVWVTSVLRAVAVFIAIRSAAHHLNRRARYLAAVAAAITVALRAALDICSSESILLLFPFIVALASVLRGERRYTMTSTERRERASAAVLAVLAGTIVAWAGCAFGSIAVSAWGEIFTDGILLIAVS